MEKDTNFTHFISKLLHISVSKLVHICTFATVAVHICTATVDLLSNILIISLSSLSLFLGCVCQFAANSPHTAQPPSNHHHHNTSQSMIFQSQNQSKTKENQTKNQSKPKINGKLNNLKLKIKLSTQNPSNQTQNQTQTQTKPPLSPPPWRACCHRKTHPKNNQTHKKTQWKTSKPTSNVDITLDLSSEPSVRCSMWRLGMRGRVEKESTVTFFRRKKAPWVWEIEMRERYNNKIIIIMII